jgi:hypothetical protein
MRVLPVSAAAGSGPEAVSGTVLAGVEAAAGVVMAAVVMAVVVMAVVVMAVVVMAVVVMAVVVMAAVAEAERWTVAGAGAGVWAPPGYTTEAAAKVDLQNHSGRRRGKCRRRQPRQ